MLDPYSLCVCATVVMETFLEETTSYRNEPIGNNHPLQYTQLPWEAVKTKLSAGLQVEANPSVSARIQTQSR